MVTLLILSVVSFTGAWFTDEKGAEQQIIPIALPGPTIIAEGSLTPEDLIAGNTFSKSVRLDIDSAYDFYYRLYAVVSVECLDENDAVVTKTDLVNVTNVSDLTYHDADGKYYSLFVSKGKDNVNHTFTFKVDDGVSEELYTDSEGSKNNTLKTTLKYYIEFCQNIGYDEWKDV